MCFALMVVQHRDQHEDHVQGQSLEVHWCQVELQQRNRGGDLAVQRGGLERVRHVCAADGIEHDVKPGADRMLGDINRNALGPVVDRRGAAPFDDFRLRGTADGREDLGALMLSQLGGDMTDAARASVHENRMLGLHLGTLEALIGGDADKR